MAETMAPVRAPLLNPQTDFASHPLQGYQVNSLDQLTAGASAFGETILHTVPPGPLQTLAYRALQEAFMWAQQAIATNRTGGVNTG